MFSSETYLYGIICLICKIFRKTNISYLLIRTHKCAYQRVRNVSLAEIFDYVITELSLLASEAKKLYIKDAEVS